MNKIYITGTVGSGKTTFSKNLSKLMNRKCYEQDVIIRTTINNERKKKSVQGQIETMHKINENDTWIIEGVYIKRIHLLLDLSDTIIFVDTHYFLRCFRIIKRYIKQQLGLELCHYDSNFQMLKWMFKWNNDFERNRLEFEEILEQYSDKLVILKNNRELKQFLQNNSL